MYACLCPSPRPHESTSAIRMSKGISLRTNGREPRCKQARRFRNRRAESADLHHAGSAQIAMLSPSRWNHCREKDDITQEQTCRRQQKQQQQQQQQKHQTQQQQKQQQSDVDLCLVLESEKRTGRITATGATGTTATAWCQGMLLCWCDGMMV